MPLRAETTASYRSASSLLRRAEHAPAAVQSKPYQLVQDSDEISHDGG
jgi:hypothetical protein